MPMVSLTPIASSVPVSILIFILMHIANKKRRSEALPTMHWFLWDILYRWSFGGWYWWNMSTILKKLSWDTWVKFTLVMTHEIWVLICDLLCKTGNKSQATSDWFQIIPTVWAIKISDDLNIGDKNIIMARVGANIIYQYRYGKCVCEVKGKWCTIKVVNCYFGHILGGQTPRIVCNLTWHDPQTSPIWMDAMDHGLHIHRVDKFLMGYYQLTLRALICLKMIQDGCFDEKTFFFTCKFFYFFPEKAFLSYAFFVVEKHHWHTV